MSEPVRATILLKRMRGGDPLAAQELLPVVYQELHRLAERAMGRQDPGHTLQATALLNEAWIRLVESEGGDWENRNHFLAVAAKAMRSVLVDHARRRGAEKRGAGRARVELDQALDLMEQRSTDLIVLDEALEELEGMDGTLARIVELRFFGGLKYGEIAEVLDSSVRTIERGWSAARAWLYTRLAEGTGELTRSDEPDTDRHARQDEDAMEPERWKRVREIFEEALDLSEERRAAYLDEACAEDAQLRAQVQGMLGADSQAPEFLEHPTGLETVLPSLRPGQPLPPTQIGAYEVVRLIAAGGMGVVYEAVQKSPRRRVALKMLRQGPLGPSAATRFHFEAEILARLRHPHVAEIYEAGVHTDESGLEIPYFAMEFVEDARDIVSYARGVDAGLRTTLAVFLEVCDAVHYGHQQGVVHRDLKPGNILVDQRGHAKVIDFGVARVTNADLEVSRLVTQTGELIGTLSYMSPEQLGGDPAAIDTRSDVYALGLVLYELLCGAGPYELAGKPMTEVARIIRDVPPMDPSLRAPDLPEDLRWIVLRALEKEREHRYASASELAADIGRFLEHQPVQAGPPSAYYRLRKFVRRNRIAVAAATLVVLALITGAVLATLGLLRASEEAERRKGETARATDEADKFRSINDVLTDMLVAVQVDEDGRDVRVVELLDRAALEVGPRLAGRPAVEAALRLVLAESYQSLGLQPQAEAQAHLSLDLWETLRQDADAERLDALKILALALAEQDRLDEAESVVREGLAASAALVDDPRPGILFVQLECTVLRKRGDYAGAAARMRELLAEAQAKLGEDSELALDVKAGLVSALGKVRVDEEVERLSRELLSAYEQAAGPDSFVTLGRRLALAAVLTTRDKLDEADTLYAQALGPMIDLVGEEHPRVLLALNELARLHVKRGEHAQGIAILEEVVRIRTRTDGPEANSTLTAQGNLASARRDVGDERSLDMSSEVYRTRRRIWGPDHPQTLEAMAGYGISLVGRRKAEEAEPLLLECLERHRAVFGQDDIKTLHAVHAVAYVYYTQQAFEDARPYFLEAWKGFRRELGRDHEQTLRTAANVVVVMGRLGEYEEAIPISTEVLAVQLEKLEPGDPNLVVITTNLGELHRKNGKPASAEAIFRQALGRAREHLPADHPLIATNVLNVAESLRDQGRHEEAIEAYAEALELSEFNTNVPRTKYARIREQHGRSLFALERYEEARAQLLIAYEVMEGYEPAVKERAAIAKALVDVFEAWDKPDQARLWRAKLPTTPVGDEGN